MGPLQFVHTEILNVTQKTNKIFPEINFYFRKNANGYESACMKCIMWKNIAARIWHFAGEKCINIYQVKLLLGSW